MGLDGATFLFDSLDSVHSYSDDVERRAYNAKDIVHEIWTGLKLPPEALTSLVLQGAHPGPAIPSSFKIGILAQSTIALSALAAATVHSLHNGLSAVPEVTVPLDHAMAEFKSERLYTLRPQDEEQRLEPIGGLHKTSDGYVRVHDMFPNHRNGILDLLSLPTTATREDVAKRISSWAAIDLENVATAEGNLAVYALRSYEQWNSLPQSKAIGNFPIDVSPLPCLHKQDHGDNLPVWMPKGSSQCLKGLRVVELSRVIAAPVCGKTLAAHGADVIWVTSPNLPDSPDLDKDLGRGKRTARIDLHCPDEKARLMELISTCDVFIQGYRPGALGSLGLSCEELVKINPNIIIANMSAFGPRGPWAGRRGFDSLVQTCSGMNISEAEHAGRGVALPTPCQALDHASGYLMATGITSAVYHRAARPVSGPWRVDVSLAGTMKYLCSLGQYTGSSDFEVEDYNSVADVPAEFFETRDTGFGLMKAIKHSASVKGCDVGWTVMPKPLGSHDAVWI